MPVEATTPFQIFVQSQHGRNTTVNDVTPETLVSDIKKKLSTNTGFGPNMMRLIFAGRHLEDEDTVGRYGIHKGDTLQFVARLHGGASKLYRVYVSGYRERTLSIEGITNETTVRELKRKVGEKTSNIRPEDMRLVFAGEQLVPDQETVHTFGLYENCTINIIARCVGGW